MTENPSGKQVIAIIFNSKQLIKAYSKIEPAIKQYQVLQLLDPDVKLHTVEVDSDD